MLYSESDQTEEQNGPSIDSDNAEDRIMARRLRIKARVEAARRMANGEKESKLKPLSDADREALRKSRKQIDHSRTRIDKLKSDGTELVTSVGVAADARETGRRLKDDESKTGRLERLTAEAKTSEEKFEEITKKWETVPPSAVAQQLHEMLMAQKAVCDAMIDEKNKLITELQQELRIKDDQYVKDLKQQAEDVDIMIERMEDQIKTLMKAYKDEVDQIESSFQSERQELVDSQTQKWEALMQERRDREEEYMKARQIRVEDFESQLQHLRTQDAEEYNRIKIKMETDVQTLEQQLQSMKATFQLNAEKLDYNFQVLKKRDEENTITKSQQKRKITRLQDSLNNLRGKLDKQEKSFRDENASLTEDYRRLSGQFQKLQEKSKHFQATDIKRFMDIWEMNEQHAMELRHKVLEADRIAYEQQLGLKWEVPAPWESPLTRIPTAKTNKGGEVVSASQVAASAFSAADSETEGVQEANVSGDVVPGSPTMGHPPAEASPLTSTALKQALELICDESGFLVEDKLRQLLSPLERNEQLLMKLDSIFKVYVCFYTECLTCSGLLTCILEMPVVK
jgi:dynein regulatory complex protein 1